MCAVVLETFGAIQNRSLKEVREPIPGRAQVLNEVQATGATFANLLVVQGTYQVLPELRFTPGRENMGPVRAVGERKRTIQPGDHLMAMVDNARLAEAASASEADRCKMPENLFLRGCRGPRQRVSDRKVEGRVVLTPRE